MEQDDNLKYVGMLMNAEKSAGEIDRMLDQATTLAMDGRMGEDVAKAGDALKKAIHDYQAAVSRWLFANIES